MLFRYFILFYINIFYLLGGNMIFDKISLVTEFNKEIDEDISYTKDNYNYLIGGVYLEKDIRLFGYTEGRFSGYAKSSENINNTSEFNFVIKEFYLERSFLGTDIRLGREIIDLSVSKIYGLNSFLSPMIPILDLKDRSLKLRGLDGISISRDIQQLNAQGFLYIYQDDLLKNIDKNPLIVMSQIKFSEPSLDANLFLGLDKNSNFVTAFGGSTSLNDMSNLYAEGHSKNNNIDYLVGFDYSFGRVSLAVERLVKEGINIQNVYDERFARYDSVNDINATADSNATVGNIYGSMVKDFSQMNSHNLLGNHYISAFLRMPIDNNIVASALLIRNMIDKSTKVVLQTEAIFNGINTTIEYEKQFENKMNNLEISEFGFHSDSLFKITLSMGRL